MYKMPEDHGIGKQVTAFITSLEKYNKKRLSPQPAENYLFLRDFYLRFFYDRNQRADEVASETYTRVKDLANKQFVAPTLWNLCMDGRVLAILINGATSGVGSSIRVPGGILREFVRGKDGKLQLIPTSNYARLLERAFYRYNASILYEVFDSHIACAARKAEELAHGYDALDDGLFADVLNKKEMADATSSFIEKKFGATKRVVTLQTSFNPHTGFLLMGLETKKAVSYAKNHGSVYTSEVLGALVQQKLLLSAEKLSKEKAVAAVFQSHLFDLDWREKYVQSADVFWHNIEKMRPLLLPIIVSKLEAIYPQLSNTKNGKEELLERAALVLTNAYSGFLHNHHGKTFGGKAERDYPYGVHREEGVKVSEGGYPPYEISMFVVFSLDKKNLAANIELASALVRSNRREKRVLDRSGTFSDPVEFAKAPVPVIIQGIVRDEVSSEEWERVSRVDWSDLPENWDSMSAPDFYTYLQSKGQMSIAVANGINRLREKLSVLYDPDNPTSSHLIEHYKVALPVIVGKSRRNYFVVPFVKLGFS
jgi:hypothetical protein